MNKTRTIVTVSLTLVFGILAFLGRITSEQYIPIYTMIVTFYFTSSFEEGKSKNDTSTVSKDSK